MMEINFREAKAWAHDTPPHIRQESVKQIELKEPHETAKRGQMDYKQFEKWFKDHTDLYE